MTWNSARALGGQVSVICESPLQQFLAMLKRQRGLALVVFAVIFFPIVLFSIFLADRYQARMEILVEQAQLRRADPAATAGPSDQPIVNNMTTTSDEAMNSEIALIQSQDVLRNVVAASGLDRNPGLWYGSILGLWYGAEKINASGTLRAASKVLPFLAKPSQDEITAKAVQRLASKLHVEILKLSNVIAVTYSSNDPQLAARVLQSLGDAYLKEHALAHRPPGQVAFFEQETAKARAAMEDAEQKVVAFTQSGGVAAGDLQLDGEIRQENDLEADQDQTHAAISGTMRRIAALEAQEGRLQPRQTTQMKTADNGILMQQLKSQLLNLQLRRTELLTKYQPTFPLVVEVDRQIVQAQQALADAQKAPVMETTTDRDPNYELVCEDLTRSRAELANLQARSASLSAAAAISQGKMRVLQQQSVQQQELLRNAKAAEDNYLLLRHKGEEARISDELDKNGILNVNIMQAASVPSLPVHPVWWYFMYGTLLGLLGAFATATGADRLDPTVRTVEEAELALHAPVLVSLQLPEHARPYDIEDSIHPVRPRRGQIFAGL
jgi:uncharacterized protein involved in exopolysaccharide biosynthesis